MMFMYDNRSAICMHFGLAPIHVPAIALELGEQDRAEQVADTGAQVFSIQYPAIADVSIITILQLRHHTSCNLSPDNCSLSS